MPKREPGSPDDCGIRYDGSVLNGQLSVQDAFSLEARQLLAQPSQKGPYAGPYLDPVLRFHLRLDPKP